VANDPSSTPGEIGSRPGWLTMSLLAISYLGILNLLDPFGTNSALMARSEQAALRVTAPFYGASGEVTVVLINDEYLADEKHSWPLPYIQQGQLLRTIFQYEPSVVFVDLLYRQKHGGGRRGEDPLDVIRPVQPLLSPTRQLVLARQSRRELQHGVLPSLCAEPDADTQEATLADPESMLPELGRWAEANGVRTAVVDWWGCGNRYPLTLTGESTPKTRTPAPALLKAWCATPGREAPGCRDFNPGDDWPDAHLDPMVVRWGAYPPAGQAALYQAGVCQARNHLDASWWHRVRRSAQQFVLGLFQDLRSAVDPNLSLPCPAVTVLGARVVRHGDPDLVREALRGKIVLVGAEVTGVSDWQQSPVHGQIPGVVLHAMAVDNLLALGTNYARDVDGRILLLLSLLILAGLAFWIPVTLVARERVAGPPSGLFKAVPVISLAVWAGIVLALQALGGSAAAVVAAVGLAIANDLVQPRQAAGWAVALLGLGLLGSWLLALGWAPGNWLGLFAVGTAFAGTAKAAYALENRQHFPATGSVLNAVFREHLDLLDRYQGRALLDRAIRWRADRLQRKLDARPGAVPASDEQGAPP
jgi:hypothetical protein